ncbi:MAG: cytochrome c3 family protein [Chloroflexi bacterium]|nr:cytochrome c3 family protein [Chloroflexota bacterium]
MCTDCHTAHAVQRVTNPNDRKQLTAEARQRIPQTCARCHNAIFEKYKKSVHGAALLENINPDVPTCIDCHGVHNIGDPTTAAFRLKSPQICAKCHTDPARMSKYGISTQVLTTYVADFHGTTVTLFEKQTPDAQTNKPVCYDCHGIHDISRVDDPQKGLEIKQNLLTRCQRCHPDATSNFPDAWLSHYIPSPEKTPLVYYVNLFYQIFIPALLGGMTVLVVLDAARRIYEKAEGRKGKGEGRYAKMKDEAESSKS